MRLLSHQPSQLLKSSGQIHPSCDDVEVVGALYAERTALAI